MITTIGFFNDKQQSKLGTLRGLIAFPIVVIAGLTWYFYVLPKIDESTRIQLSLKSVLSLIVASIILVSAVGVQLPTDTKTASTYGALVGFCIFGILNLFKIAHDRSILVSIIDVAFGITLTSVCSSIVYKSGYYDNRF
jgi:uncharacterized membrane protein